MNFGAIFKTPGCTLMIFAPGMLSALIVALIYEENLTFIYLVSAIGIFTFGFSLWHCNYKANKDLLPRDGFLAVIIPWPTVAPRPRSPLVAGPICPGH